MKQDFRRELERERAARKATEAYDRITTRGLQLGWEIEDRQWFDLWLSDETRVASDQARMQRWAAEDADWSKSRRV